MKMMNKLKTSLPRYILNLMALTVFWGGLLRKNYNADTVAHMADPAGDVIVRIRFGRYVIALLEKIQVETGILCTDHLPVTILITLMICALTLTMLQLLFEKDLGFRTDTILQKAGLMICFSLVYLNVLYSEFLMFGEFCLYMAIAYAFIMFGVVFYVKEGIAHKITGAVFFLLGVFTYQNAAVIGSMVLLFYYMLKHDFKWSKEAVRDEFFAAVVPFGAGVINLITVKIVAAINPLYQFFRPIGVGSISDKIAEACVNFYSLNKDSYNLLPRVFLPGLLNLGMIVMIVYLLIKRGDKAGVGYFATAYILSLALLYILPIMNSPFTFPPRLAIFFYLLQGLTGATLMWLMGKEGSGKPDPATLRTVFSIVLVGYLWIHLIFVQFIITGRYISNNLDNVYCRLTLQEIEKYENSTGVTVQNLCVFNDDDAPAYYRESSIHTYQINERIIGQATCSYMEAILGRHFEPLHIEDVPADIYSKYFEGKDWEFFDPDEQLLIVGDTAYWCVY